MTLDLLHEADTQEYAYEALKQRPELSNFIRVPKVYRSVVKDVDNYYSDGRHGTLVLIEMEYVHGRTIRKILQNEISGAKKHLLWDRVVLALGALLTLEPSKNTSPGPEGGGRIEHIIFGDYCEYNYAPQDFDSVEELQTHINNTIVNNRFRSYGPTIRYDQGPCASRVDFSKEKFRLCYCDVHQSNFMLADKEGERGEVGPVYVIDFRHCMWLPVTFMNWALKYNGRDPLFNYVREKLEQRKDLPSLEEPNFEALKHYCKRLLKD